MLGGAGAANGESLRAQLELALRGLDGSA